jgi:NADPH-dependent glutamate synthase beta subunit-like oxidoreductase
MGHEVEIRDAGPVAGGMMHFGIPAYRLPRDVLDGEIDRIRRQGVIITLNHKVEELAREKAEGGFDAAFVAVGAHLSKRIEIPGRDAAKIYDAVGFLRDVESGAAPKLGRRVAIYGGGNTAMDAARTAKRLGHEPMIIYRRDREHMPAHDFEADEALEEGVRINWLRTIKSIDAGGMQVEVMEIDPETGRPRPTGRIETVEADDLILALGQDTDAGFLRNLDGLAFTRDGSVAVDANMMTGAEGVFAGGDMVPSDRTATIAVGHGKKAARAIDAWLRDVTPARTRKPALASFDKLHLWFYTDVAQRPQDHLPLSRRQSTFEEVVKGLSDAEAAHEAKRCLSCGNCFECDGCYGACPEDAIARLGPGKGYSVDFDLCTGCAICFEQCPCHAISMIPEPSPNPNSGAGG